MRRFALALAVLTVIAPVLAACDSLDTIELFDSKKKLPGERKSVFPEGVPGVTSGIPPEIMKGYREPETALPDPVAAAAEAAAARPVAVAKPSPEAKPKPQRTASRPPPPTDGGALRPSLAPSTSASAPPARPAPASAAAPQAPPPPQSAPLPWPTSQPAAPWPTQ